MVQVSIGGSGEFEGSEADIIESFVVNDHALVSVFDQLMHGQGGVVGFDHGIGDFGGGDDGKGFHHTVGVLLSDFGDEQGSHSRSSASSERVGDLETL